MAEIPDVVGATEAKEILGVELQRISRWIASGKLPAPYARPSCGPVWFRDDIDYVAVHGEPSPDAAVTPTTLPWFGTGEVAELLDVDKSQISRWRRRPNKSGPAFPEPFITIAAGPLWERALIERYATERAEYHAEQHATIAS